MAELIVISFDNETDAHGAYGAIQELKEKRLVELTGLALITADADGKTHVETSASGPAIGIGAAGGALFGTLIGVLFFVPFVGLVFGGALGALFAGLDKSGIDGEFRDRVRSAVRHGQPAVVVYASSLAEDEFGKALAPFHGVVAKTSLSPEQEKALAEDLGEDT